MANQRAQRRTSRPDEPPGEARDERPERSDPPNQSSAEAVVSPDGGTVVEESLDAASPPRDESEETADALSLSSDVAPQISFVLPTKNEAAGIQECIRQIRRVVRQMGMTAEIIVSDSSTDRTPEIAAAEGAIVIEPDQDGYGYAYRYAFERARGSIIVMGDADCTYDFGEVPKLLEPIRNDEADMVMGSRFAGEIKPGAMPPLHQHVGNPLLTTFLNVFYQTDVTDAHCGLRALTHDAAETLDLQSKGMEFASEMVMDASVKDLQIAEVPITYHERKGDATLESFRDGWRHVKFMLMNAPSYLFTAPGILISALGVLTMGLSFFDVQPGTVTFGTHTMIAGSLLLLLGFQVGMLGVFSAIATNPIRRPTDPITERIRTNFRFEDGARIGVTFFGSGGVYGSYLLGRWLVSDPVRIPTVPENILAFTLVILGTQIFFGSFHLSALIQETEQ
jgi:hypothetical protein